MNTKYWFVLVALAGLILVGCDMMPGAGGEQQPAPMQTAPGMAQPAPAQPVTQPGIPAPAQPIPGQPAQVQPIPGQPVPAQPTAVQPAVPGAAVAPTPDAPAAVPQVTGDLLIDRLNAEKTKIAADWIATSSMVRQRLDKNKQQSYQVQLPGPPFCHTYLAVGDDEVKNLDLSIDSPTGIPEAKDSVDSNIAAVQNHCPNVAGAFQVNVAMAGGQGEFAIQVYSKAR